MRGRIRSWGASPPNPVPVASDAGGQPCDRSLQHSLSSRGGGGLSACAGHPIGPEGATFTIPLLDGTVTVEVLPGAVDREIRLTGISRCEPRPGAASCVVELGPTGAQFHRPVLLRFKPGARDIAGKMPLALLQVAVARGETWDFIPTTLPAAGVIEGATTHFSSFALVAPCRAAGTGTDFLLVGCPTFNPRVQASVPVTLDVTAGSVTVRIWVTASASATQATLTVSGLQGGAMYYLIRDGGTTALPVPADASGAVRFVQDIAADHLILLSSRPGSLTLTASTCVAPVGTFDAATSTCTLTQDIPGANVSIDQAGLILDCKDAATGARHTIGSATARASVGVGVFRRTGVAVRNCNLVNVDFGTLVGQSPGLRVQDVTATVPSSGLPGAVGFDQAVGHGSSYTDVSTENFVQGLGTTGVDNLVVRRATIRTAKPDLTAFAVGVFQETGALLEDVTIDGAPSGPGPSDPAASVPTGLAVLSESTGATVTRLAVNQLGAFGADLAVIFGATATVRAADLRGARSGVLLLGLAASEITDSTLTGNREGLDIRDGAHRVFHNNIFGNTVRQVFSVPAIELSDTRATSPTFQQGNFWGRRCPEAFKVGVDSNRADVVDSFPYEDKDGWLAGTVPGCKPATPVINYPQEGQFTRDATTAIAGTSTPGSSVSIRADGSPVASTVASADGDFLTRPTSPLAEGPHTLVAVAQVGARTSDQSEPVRFVVDASPPAPPIILAPTQGMTTSDAFMGVAGRSEPFAEVTILDGSIPIGRGGTSGAGDFSVQSLVPFAAGGHSLRGFARDRAGNTSDLGPGVTFSVVALSPTTLVEGVRGVLRLTSFADAPDPFDVQSQPFNVLRVAGMANTLQGLNSSSLRIEFSVVVRRELIDPLRGVTVATVTSEAPLFGPPAPQKSVDVAATNAWDGKDARGTVVPPATYLYSARVALTRTAPGRGVGAPPDCVADATLAVTSGRCVVDVSPTLFGTVLVLRGRFSEDELSGLGYDRLEERLVALKREVPSGATTEMSAEQLATFESLTRHMRERQRQWEQPPPAVAPTPPAPGPTQAQVDAYLIALPVKRDAVSGLPADEAARELELFKRSFLGP